MNGVLEFRERHRELWTACVAVRPEKVLVESLLRLHRYYHEDLDVVFKGRLGALPSVPRPLAWAGLDVLKIAGLLDLSERLEETLREAELFDPADLAKETPIRFLDEEDFVDVLEDVGADEDVGAEAALFTAAVFYLKTSCKSCSRRA